MEFDFNIIKIYLLETAYILVFKQEFREIELNEYN